MKQKPYLGKGLGPKLGSREAESPDTGEQAAGGWSRAAGLLLTRAPQLHTFKEEVEAVAVL